MTSKQSRPPTTLSPQPAMHPTADIDPSLSDAENAQSLFDALVRYVSQTFYEVPKSSVLQHIYHQGPVTEKDLTLHLHLTPKLAHQHLEDLKRDRLIVRARNPTSVDLSYHVDIAAFVDVVRYRLIKMREAIEEKDQQRIMNSMNYTCQECSREYPPDIVVNYYDRIRDCILCPKCSGIVQENDPIDGIISMRLFNQQMTPLYDLLQKIDQIITDQVLISCSSARNSSERAILAAAARRRDQEMQIIIESDEPFPGASASINALHCSIAQRRKRRGVTDKNGSPPWFTRPLFPGKDSPPDIEPEDDVDGELERLSAENAARLQEIHQLLLEYESARESSSSEDDESVQRSPSSFLSAM